MIRTNSDGWLHTCTDTQTVIVTTMSPSIGLDKNVTLTDDVNLGTKETSCQNEYIHEI